MHGIFQARELEWVATSFSRILIIAFYDKLIKLSVSLSHVSHSSKLSTPRRRLQKPQFIAGQLEVQVTT